VCGGAGYTTLAQNLLIFNELHQLPSSLKLDRLDDGEGLESTLFQRSAKYHKSCSLKYNDKNLQRARKRKYNDADSDMSERFTRQKQPQSNNTDITSICLFCDKIGSAKNPLRNASTGDLDTKVKQCAINLQDQHLLAKLSRGDVVAIDMKYHPQCLVGLYNRNRSLSNTSHTDTSHDRAKNTAFAELLSYMQAVLDSDETTPVFELSELIKLYKARAFQLDNDDSHIHATRFKDRILSYFPQLEAHNEGRGHSVLLVLSGTAGTSIRNTCQLDGESETVIMSHVADFIRRDIFGNKCPSFDGSFADDCQHRSVPPSLLTLIAMILYGTNIKHEANYQSQTALSLSQLLVFNSVRHLNTEASDTRHSRDREPPLPLFLGACIHSKTRSKDLVDILYRMGLSVSYDRVLNMSADLANSTINHFETIGAVCPPSLKHGLFTTSAVDNIDHDPTSTTAQTSFHGTGISIFQHPDREHSGTKQVYVQLEQSTRKIAKLPEEYTSIPAVVAIKDPPIPEVDGLRIPNCLLNLTEETMWCKHVYDILSTPLDLDHPREETNRENMGHGLCFMLTSKMLIKTV